MEEDPMTIPAPVETHVIPAPDTTETETETETTVTCWGGVTLPSPGVT
jgi:hypothetical protein